MRAQTPWQNPPRLRPASSRAWQFVLCGCVALGACDGGSSPYQSGATLDGSFPSFPSTTGSLSDGGATTGTTGSTGFTTGTTGVTTGTTALTTTTGTTGTTGSTGFTTGTTAVTTGTTGATTGTTGTTGSTGTTGTTGTTGSGAFDADPEIPAVSGDCPTFATGDFNFGGLTGQMTVGPKGSGDGALVFYWHGTGGQAGNYASNFGIGSIGSGNIDRITAAGGIIFAVQGETGSGDNACSGTAVFSGDFSVIDQVVACAVRDHAINPRRIYATGCSAGGLQSGCMASRRSNYVAAVAPNSGGLTTTFGFSFSGGYTPASMTMHGGADDTVFNLNFGTSSASLNGLVTGAGGYAVDCNHMSGHCGAPGALYDRAFDFLFAHPYGASPEPYAGGLPGDFPDYCSAQ